MAVLAIRTPEDGLLGALAPLGLGAAVDTALVVDLDQQGPRYPSAGSLAGLVSEGPRRSDLTPTRSGLAVLRNGGIEAPAAADVIAALVAGWPAVVLRLPGNPQDGRQADVVVHPLVPGSLFPVEGVEAVVYQDLGFRIPAEGPVLPILRRPAAAALLAGTVPRRSSWVRAWRSLWEPRWE